MSSNKKLYIEKKYILTQILPIVPDIKNNRDIDIAIYHDMYNQHINDIDQLLNDSQYDESSKKKINEILKSSKPFFAFDIREINILNVDYITNGYL